MSVPLIPVESAPLAELATANQDLELPVAIPVAISQIATPQGDRYPLVLQVFCSSFVTIFLAELGDKTQVTTLLMSAESQSPWVVFAGAGSALVLTSLLGVLLGQWLSTRLAPRTLEVAAGLSLLLVSVLLVWDIIQS